MYISDQFLWTCLQLAGRFGALGCSARDGGLVVETVEIATGFLKFFDPFLWLYNIWVRLKAWIEEYKEVVPPKSSYGSQMFPSHVWLLAYQHDSGFL